jgi:RHS repeat-associated protein
MVRTYFFWDPLSDNILQERDETGAVTAEYTAEPGLYGNIISQNRGGVESQFHYDAQGSTLAVTDDNHNVTDTFAYTAFGEITERTGTTEVPFQYIGQKGYYTDSVTGQIMVRERPYQLARARWMLPDPLGQMLGRANLYTYAANSPTVSIDPSGLAPESKIRVPGLGELSLPSIPCGIVTIEANPPHSLAIYTNGDCPENNRVFRVGVRLQIDDQINKSKPIHTFCPPPCIVCEITDRSMDVPITTPIIVIKDFYWRQGVFKPIEVKKGDPGARLCHLLVIGTLSLLLDIESGTCKAAQ